MPINRDFVGRTYPPSEPYEVGREKIREFAEAIGDPNPAYRDREEARALGHRDVVAPPTFPIVISMRVAARAVADPELAVDYSMVVHGEQRFEYTRPVYAGDVLTGSLSIADIRAAGRNELLTTKVDLTTADGEHVCTAYSTLVVRGGAEQEEGS
ncbi:MAG: MaoC family dehydratase N-terminal domain-containing protein [Streptosporangiaceae bacterium]